ncbi:hypothetical protein [Streptoalloteichus hindustanus]|uniref:Uncharacterized protein n=1 Tax=Streptoalloteichus hindustanus TaxID=2017 RepID=A0A1M5NAV2_STRHI|nr:hypothetical protein [Streptoalloteichus hindustanus]SHG86684.1 hypothetical protein SAMN05444320_11563 [Streptoalloteichus hindustanus]
MKIPPRWHLVSYYRIKRGQQVLCGQRTLDDDYWYLCPGGPEGYALALAREFFLKERAVRGDRWVVTVYVLASERGTPECRLCSVSVTVPAWEELARKPISGRLRPWPA